MKISIRQHHVSQSFMVIFQTVWVVFIQNYEGWIKMCYWWRIKYIKLIEIDSIQSISHTSEDICPKSSEGEYFPHFLYNLETKGRWKIHICTHNSYHYYWFIECNDATIEMWSNEWTGEYRGWWGSKSEYTRSTKICKCIEKLIYICNGWQILWSKWFYISAVQSLDILCICSITMWYVIPRYILTCTQYTAKNRNNKLYIYSHLKCFLLFLT